MCDVCLVDPTTHSFEFCTKQGDTHVFYTTFKSIKDYSNMSSILRHFQVHLNVIKDSPWGYIIDCKHLSAKHIVNLHVGIAITRLLTESYSATLRFIYLINAGPVMKGVLLAFKPFVGKEFFDTVLKLNGSPVELYEQLKQTGFTPQEVEPLMRLIQKNIA